MSMPSAGIPVLASLDFDETAAFYAGRLGFQPRLRTNDTLIRERDGCAIQFWRAVNAAGLNGTGGQHSHTNTGRVRTLAPAARWLPAHVQPFRFY